MRETLQLGLDDKLEEREGRRLAKEAAKAREQERIARASKEFAQTMGSDDGEDSDATVLISYY